MVISNRLKLQISQSGTSLFDSIFRFDLRMRSVQASTGSTTTIPRLLQAFLLGGSGPFISALRII